MSTEIRIPNTDVPTRLPSGKRGGSFLVEETRSMDRRRREVEQGEERRLARVNAKERSEEEVRNGPEELPQNNIKEHPYLANPLWDGREVDPKPALNTAAHREKENRDRDLQNRLTNTHTPKFNSAPTPRGP